MIRWWQLILMAAMLWLALWAAVRVWASQPTRENRCAEACHCICPECP